MTKTRWIIFILLCLGILGIIIFTNKNDSGSSGYSGDASKIITDGAIPDHVYGSTEGKVTMIEYGDFQCPGCGKAYVGLKELKEKYKDGLSFVFRNLPLTTIHSNALAAATAAEAAGRQDKFFEYHDLLYENQVAWQSAPASDRSKTFETYAQQLGLDLAKFKADLASPEVADKISRDRSTAAKFGFKSTPSMVLNGQTVPESTIFDKDKLEQLIIDEYKKANIPLPSTN